jgi:hypothetical protein
MKINNLKLNTRFFALAYLCAIPLISNSPCKAYDEAKLAEVVKEFLDIHNKEHQKKPFHQFADEFQQALSGNQVFKLFCEKLNKFKHKRNATIIGALFLEYKHLMPPVVKTILDGKNKKELVKIFKIRVQAQAA